MVVIFPHAFLMCAGAVVFLQLLFVLSPTVHPKCNTCYCLDSYVKDAWTVVRTVRYRILFIVLKWQSSIILRYVIPVVLGQYKVYIVYVYLHIHTVKTQYQVVVICNILYITYCYYLINCCVLTVCICKYIYNIYLVKFYHIPLYLIFTTNVSTAGIFVKYLICV